MLCATTDTRRISGWICVQGLPGLEAVRIGRTVDLPQRLRWFEWRYLPIEVILVGECSSWEYAPEAAEIQLFSLLDEIHLSRHNCVLHGALPTYDSYLPDKRKIIAAFSRLCRKGPFPFPLLTRFFRQPLFDRVTKNDPRGGRSEAELSRR